MKIPSLSDIQEAQNNIDMFINHTPIQVSGLLNKKFNSSLYFKCENFQKVGAFKFRGATNAVLNLSSSERVFGVATHSSGNHAQALALAAKMQGLDSYIVMPNNSPKVKSNAVAGYGANITFCEPNLRDRELSLEKIIESSKANVIHPYENYNVICGQGTVALEILDTVQHLDMIIAPVGGGGLLSGTAIATKELNPNIKVYGAEPLGANDAFRSLKENKLIPSVNPDTICDGLLTSLGEINFEIIQKYVDDIFTVTDQEVIEAMKLIWERMKIIIEPSSATVLAAVMVNMAKFEGKNIGLILSGGNVDLDNLPW